MYRPTPRVLTRLLLLSIVSVAMAGPTYRWVDAQGVVHYSDTPQPGAQQVALPPPQTYHATPAPAVAPASDAAAGDAAVYQSCAITQPGAQQSLFSPQVVAITVGLMPPLRPGDSVLVTMDGSPLQPSSDSALAFPIADVDRGQHVLTAVVRNSAGNVLCSAKTVTFYVQRPSTANPVSPVKPH